MAEEQGYESKREYDKDVERVPDFIKMFWTHSHYQDHIRRKEMPEEAREKEYEKTDPPEPHPFDKIEKFFETYTEERKPRMRRKR